MTITLSLNEGFYSGSGTSEDVPGKYDVALNGVGFMLDNKHETFKGGISTIPLLRSQADSGDEPGESSTNPEDLWPRSQHSWHKGAGQQWLDHDDGDRFRYYNSRGIDPWTRGEIKTLGGTAVVETAGSPNGLVTLGDWVYMASDGDVLRFYEDITTNDPGVSSDIHAGEAPSYINSITTDGFSVYAAVDDGIHVTEPLYTFSSHYSDQPADVIGWVKGRLMAGYQNDLFNIVAPGAAPTALFTHPASYWRWSCFAEGTGCIYAAGSNLGKSAIYSITVKDDGTGLNVPRVAGELPEGETVYSMCGYLGYLLIGTDKGVRTATQDANNFLTIGALIPLNNPVRCFEPQENFVWFGWEDFDDNFTGLGRLDLSTFTDENVPAYSSDLMKGSVVPGFGVQGQVTGIVTAFGRRVFTIDGVGLVREDPQPHTTDYPFFETSEITFGVPDDKVALKLAIEHELLEDYQFVSAYIKVDGGDYTLIGSNQANGTRHPPQPFSIDQVTGSVFQLKFVLGRESTTPTTLNRYTLRAYPVPIRGRTIVVPLLLHEHFEDAHGAQAHLDPKERREYVRELATSGRLVQYQELDTAYSVFIDQTQFERHSRTQSGNTWNGTLACKLKVLGD